jgi:uncharacterized protein (UPF0332 family)
MKEETAKLLKKASRAIAAARTLLATGDADFAAGRAYYAMFYTAEALLAEKGRRYRKHGGVHAAYGEDFAKSGTLDPKFHRWLLDAFDKRLLADYTAESVITAADADEMIAQAGEFLEAARQVLVSDE